MSRSIRIAVALALAVAFVLTMSVVAFGHSGGRNGGEGKPVISRIVKNAGNHVSGHVSERRHRAGDDQYDRDDDDDRDERGGRHDRDDD